MWDSPPWLIGGGVEHSVETCRLLAYAAFGGTEGVIGAKDLEVAAQGVPNGTVRVFPGACAINDRSPVGAYQAYAARKIGTDDVPIAPTGGAARSDMIVARIENPFYDGSPWPHPGDDAVDRQNYQYVKLAVISGVASNAKRVDSTLGYSAIPLARIDLPASTSTVQNSHITDLRSLASVQRQSENAIIVPTELSTLDSADFANWPTDSAFPVSIPDWATHVDLRVIIGGVLYGATGANGGDGWGAKGQLRLRLGTDLYTQSTAYDVSNEGGRDRAVLMAGQGDVKIPAAMRGTTVNLRVQGKKTSGSTDIRTNSGSTLAYEAHFKAKPESNL